MTSKHGKVISIFGGKWTSSLSMSRKVTNMINRELK